MAAVHRCRRALSRRRDSLPRGRVRPSFALARSTARCPDALAPIAVVTLAFYWSRQLYPGYRLHGYELLRRRCDAALRVGAVSCAAMLLLTGAWNGALLIALFLVIAVAVQPLMRSLVRGLLWRSGIWGERAAILGEPAGGRRRRRLLYPALAIRHPSATGGLRRTGSFSRPDRGRAALPARGREASAPVRRRVMLADFPGLPISGLRPSEIGGEIGLRFGGARPQHRRPH